MAPGDWLYMQLATPPHKAMQTYQLSLTIVKISCLLSIITVLKWNHGLFSPTTNFEFTISIDESPLLHYCLVHIHSWALYSFCSGHLKLHASSQFCCKESTRRLYIAGFHYSALRTLTHLWFGLGDSIGHGRLWLGFGYSSCGTDWGHRGKLPSCPYGNKQVKGRPLATTF